VRQIAPARKPSLDDDFKIERTEDRSPLMFVAKPARPGASAPLLIVNPADAPVPKTQWYVFVNDSETAIAQHAAHFLQHEANILRVMQNITEQHCVE